VWIVTQALAYSNELRQIVSGGGEGPREKKKSRAALWRVGYFIYAPWRLARADVNNNTPLLEMNRATLEAHSLSCMVP
jgi:hypothetical protein